MIFDISDVYEWLETAGQPQDKSKLKLAYKLVHEELAELENGLVTDNKKEVLDGFVDTFWVLTNLAYFYGLSLSEIREYIEKVSTSNWSKFCRTEQEAIDTVEAYKNGTHPDKPGQVIDAYYKQHDIWWVVKRDDGKVLKNKNYFNVNQL